MKHDEYTRTCGACETRLPRAARYCSHCGQSVRELEAFETPVEGSVREASSDDD